MPRFTDLSIHVRMAWSRQHILNGGPKDAVVPGWFLRVTRNEGYDDVVPETQLSKAEVERIAGVIDGVLKRTGMQYRVTRAVGHAAQEQRVELERRLAAAEKAAEEIPALRAQLEAQE